MYRVLLLGLLVVCCVGCERDYGSKVPRYTPTVLEWVCVQSNSVMENDISEDEYAITCFPDDECEYGLTVKIEVMYSEKADLDAMNMRIEWVEMGIKNMANEKAFYIKSRVHKKLIGG